MSRKTIINSTVQRTQPTSTSVAILAGVSQATVSRVFNGGAFVSENVRERVLRAAEELKYQPNALPGMLQTGRSGIVAVVMGGLYNPFYTELLRHLTPALRARGHEVMLVDTESDDRFESVVGGLSRYRIDGVISALAVRSAAVARRLENINAPIVAVNSRRFGHIRTISTDNRAAGARAADELIDSGCKNLAYLAGRENPSQVDRQRGFIHRAGSRGLTNIWTIQAGFTYEEGFSAAIDAMSREPKPDGIFCVNDLVALGAIDAIKTKFGLSIPDDMQIIGFDDIPMAAWKGYELTTFKQGIEAFATGCVELLKNETGTSSIQLVPELIVRNTTSQSSSNLD